MTVQWDTWDAMRAHSWDAGEIQLPALLGLIGAGGKPFAEQQDALRAWLASPPAEPAPEYLKHQVREFLAKPPPPEPPAPQVPVQQSRWQAKLDKLFPGGAIVTWAGTTAPVPIPWIQVASLQGLDPELVFYHPGWTKNGKVLVSLGLNPEHGHLFTMKFTDGSECQLSSVIPEGLDVQLAKMRADVIAGNTPTPGGAG